MASESPVLCPAQQHVIFCNLIRVPKLWNTELEITFKSSILKSKLALNFWS